MFTDKNATKLWKQIITHIQEKGIKYVDAGNRACYEVPNTVAMLRDPENANIEEPFNTLASSQDWAYPSKKQLLDVMFDAQYIHSFPYSYGQRMLNYQNSVNQVKDYVVPLLKQRPKTRKAIINVFDPDVDSDPSAAATPGIIYIHFAIRKEKLHLTASFRSTDIFFGYPANLLQLFYLQRWVASELEKPLGNLTVISNSAHIFQDSIEDIKTLLSLHET